MTTKVAINGLGRIGQNLAYLLRFDTVYGCYSKSVTMDGGQLVVDGRKLRTLKNRDPANCRGRSSESSSCSSASRNGALHRRTRRVQ